MGLEFFDMTFGRGMREAAKRRVRRDPQPIKFDGGPDARDNIADQLGCNTDEVEEKLGELMYGIGNALAITPENLDELTARAEEEDAKENPRWLQERRTRREKEVGEGLAAAFGTPSDGNGPSDEGPTFFEGIRKIDEVLEEANETWEPILFNVLGFTDPMWGMEKRFRLPHDRTMMQRDNPSWVLWTWTCPECGRHASKLDTPWGAAPYCEGAESNEWNRRYAV